MPDPNDDVLEVDVTIPVTDDGDNLNGDDDMAEVSGMGYWVERLYRGTDLYDTDSKFFENALKSSHLEGKMSAREMTFAKGGGLPTVMPLPANQNVNPTP